MPNPIINRRLISPKSSYNSAINAWAAKVVTNGGASPSAATLTALNTFYNGLVSNSLLSSVISCCCFVKDNLIASITPLISVQGNNPWTNHNFVSGDLSVNGLKGNGSTKYLDSGLNMSSMAHYVAGTNLGIVLYMPDLASTLGSSFMDSGAINTNNSSTNVGFFPSLGGTTYFENAGYPGSGVATGTPSYSGYYSGQRVDGTDSRIFFANSAHAHAQLGSTATGTTGGGINGNLVFFSAWDYYNNVIYLPSSRTISFAAVTLGLSPTQDSTLYSLVQTLRTTLGGGYN